MNQKIGIRTVKIEDNLKLATIIKQVLIEFKANIKGTAFTDKKTNTIYQNYQSNKSSYFVALINGNLVGGGGIAPISNKYPLTCVLQKMYLLPKARGLKIGYRLINNCFEFAKQNGFKQCYLDTFPNMKTAQAFYLKLGFKYLKQPLVKSCNTACNIYMLKKL